MELLNRAKVEPTIAMAYQEFLKIDLGVIVTEDDVDATRRTGRPTFHYKINEALMEVLVAARAADGENGKGQRIESGHGESPN